jgi:hypothetical protein
MARALQVVCQGGNRVIALAQIPNETKSVGNRLVQFLQAVQCDTMDKSRCVVVELVLGGFALLHQ